MGITKFTKKEEEFIRRISVGSSRRFLSNTMDNARNCIEFARSWNTLKPQFILERLASDVSMTSFTSFEAQQGEEVAEKVTKDINKIAGSRLPEPRFEVIEPGSCRIHIRSKTQYRKGELIPGGFVSLETNRDGLCSSIYWQWTSAVSSEKNLTRNGIFPGFTEQQVKEYFIRKNMTVINPSVSKAEVVFSLFLVEGTSLWEKYQLIQILSVLKNFTKYRLETYFLNEWPDWPGMRRCMVQAAPSVAVEQDGTLIDFISHEISAKKLSTRFRSSFNDYSEGVTSVKDSSDSYWQLLVEGVPSVTHRGRLNALKLLKAGC